MNTPADVIYWKQFTLHNRENQQDKISYAEVHSDSVSKSKAAN